MSLAGEREAEEREKSSRRTILGEDTSIIIIMLITVRELKVSLKSLPVGT